MRHIAIALLALLCNLLPATAADLSRIYSKPTLEYWGGRYKISTTKILNAVIWPALLSHEKSDLGRKPTLEFPFWGEGEGKARQDPLAFYVPANRNSIVFPVFSLKFLDDLCTAYAWLQIKGYSLETISEYTSILMYGKPPPNGFPPPLKALGIPANALHNPQVNELALGHFVTARTFLLLHEMGHIRYHHTARTSTESIRNEQQADEFAARVMSRTLLPPLGILVFFMADANWSAFPNPSTHPLSGKRVRALADHLDDPGLVAKLRNLGKLLDDPDIRAGFVATGKAGDIKSLSPRHAGQLPRRPITSVPANRRVLFDGVYEGKFIQFSDPKPIPVQFILKRRGDRVQGRYNFGLGFATIEGTIINRQLAFNWEWAGTYGHGVLDGRSDGSFTGTWGYREARSGAGTVTGRRSP